MKESIHLNITDSEQILSIAKALSSEQRLNILKLLDNEVMNISEIAARLDIPMSSAALHIRILEESGLVITQPLPGIRGSQKLSGIKADKLSIDIKPSYKENSSSHTAYYSIPIGNYFDFHITAPCGMVSEEKFLSAADETAAFYHPERNKAQLIWFTSGYLEYRIDNFLLKKAHSVESLDFSFEACSEAQGYNNDWPSDITLWINNTETGTFRSEGDFGGVRGTQNPSWWADTMTQYGMLHHLVINHEGCYIDGVKASSHTLSSLDIFSGECILFRIGVKPDAKYAGGLNLFGEHFGNTSQHINLKVNYTSST